MENQNERPGGWVKIGTFGVDSGQVLITDPCYLKAFINDEKEDFDENKIKAMQKSGKYEYSYNGACAVTMKQPKCAGTIGLSENGIVAESGYGDGEYAVWANYQDGRVKELKIKFF